MRLAQIYRRLPGRRVETYNLHGGWHADDELLEVELGPRALLALRASAP